MDSMKIVMIAVVVSMPIGNIALPLANNMDLRECEFEIPRDFETSCNGDFIHSLPLCGSGHRLINRCVREASKACDYCEPENYQPYHNNCSTCHRCTVCGSHQRMVQSCTVDEDTKCEDVEPVDIVSSDVPSSPAATAPPGTTTPSIPSTVDRTTVDVGTFEGTSVTKISTGTSQEHITTPSVDYVSEDGSSGIPVVIALSVLVAILSVLCMILLGCCLHYKWNADALRRRDLNHNQADRDIELNVQANRCNGYEPVPRACLDEPAQPPCPNGPAQHPAQPPCLGGPAAETMQQPLSPQEPVYATVKKTKDPGRVQGVPLKSSDDPLQSPSSSSTRQSARRHTVCNTVRKVLKRDGESAAKPVKKKREPGSEVEKGALLSSDACSSKCNSKSKSPSSPLQSADDQPAPLPSEEEPQLTVTSLPKSSSSSSLPPKQTPPPSSSSSHPPPSSSPDEESLQKPLVASLPQSSPLPHTPPASPSPSSSLLDVNSIDREQLQNSTVETENDPGKGGSENYHGTDHSIEEESGNRVTEDLTTGAQAGVSITPGAKPKLSKSYVGEGGSKNESGDEDITMEEQDTGCRRMVRDGAGCLPSANPGVKPKVRGPDPGDDVAEKTREELKPLLDPDLVVTESFLDYVTEVVNLELVERISRKLGLENVSISNRKLSLPNYDPKTIGFKILLDVRNQLGCKLTYREMLTTLKKCGQKNAGDKLIAEFGINMDLENR